MRDLWHTLSEETIAPTYHFGTRRAVAPAETLRRIMPLLPQAGITRLADVTGLDWVGMPVYQAIRPNSRNLSVSQGKGLTRAQAQVSALMESLECFHGEEIRQPTIRATVAEQRTTIGYDPYTLPTTRNPHRSGWEPGYDRERNHLGEPTLLNDHMPIEWVAATDLWTGADNWVPKLLVDLDFSVQERISFPIFLRSSNGLASGNTVIEALIHALCEVVERDCLWRHRTAKHDPDRCIDLSTVTSKLAQKLIERFARAGLTTMICDISGPVGLPCFEVTLAHNDAPTSYGGAGCHPNRGTALLRALTEAAQSRVTMIAGSRDDIFRGSYRNVSTRRDELAHEFRRNYRSVPTLPSAPLAATLREIIARVRAFTGVAPLAVDLRREEFGLPVVHVVAPGLRISEEE